MAEKRLSGPQVPTASVGPRREAVTEGVHRPGVGEDRGAQPANPAGREMPTVFAGEEPPCLGAPDRRTEQRAPSNQVR
jgi:hypothetical protein